MHLEVDVLLLVERSVDIVSVCTVYSDEDEDGGGGAVTRCPLSAATLRPLCPRATTAGTPHTAHRIH